MRCAKAQELIVLIPSGDASAVEARRVADHIERCETCSRLAAAEPLPFASLRTAVPLGQSDYAAVRARVLSGLRPDRRPSVWISPFRLAAATVALVIAVGVMGLLLSRPDVAGEPRTVAVVKEMPERTAELMPPPASIARAPEAAEGVERHAREIPISAAPVADPLPSPPDPPPSIAALEKTEELRIQIQTSDPDVRIIWILNPTVEFGPIFPEEKS